MPTPTFKAVIFDLDGLMLNTEDIFDIAGRQLLERRGLQMTDEIHHSMLGRRPNEAFQAMKDLTGIEDPIDDLKQETKELFAEASETHLAMMPGLLEFLERIEQLKLPKAVATSSPQAYLQDMLGKFDLLTKFQFTLAAEDVTEGKPNPEIYRRAMSLLQVEPEQTMVLEDSETGTKAGVASGAFTVSIPNRHTAVGDFSGASLIVDSLRDERLLNLLPMNG